LVSFGNFGKIKHHFQNHSVNEEEKETTRLIKHVNKPLTKKKASQTCLHTCCPMSSKKSFKTTGTFKFLQG